MAQTELMRADEIVAGFNGITERQYWRATIAGTRNNPEVHFNSRATMVRVTYRLQHDDFAVTFNKTSAAFGDFMASAFRAMSQILVSLKAAGLPFAMPLDGPAVLRIEYEPHRKDVTVYMANLGDAWREVEPAPFKDPVRNNSLTGLDGL